MGKTNYRALKKLDNIEDNGGWYRFSVWKNGNHVDGDLYLDCYEDMLSLAEENNADEIEAAVWYSEDDYNNSMEADDFFSVWHR